MHGQRPWRLCAMIVLLAMRGVAWAGEGDSGAFPEFRVPGQEAAMASLESLFRLHYGPRTDCALWYPWLPWASVWPAVGPDATADAMRAYYRASLLAHRIDAEGYVATQQHRGLAHGDGWPFPTWPQAQGAGWHFSMAGDGYAVSLGTKETTSLEGWETTGLEVVGIDPTLGVRLRVTAQGATLTTPPVRVEAISAPYLRLEWSSEEQAEATRLRLFWSTEGARAFGPERCLEVPARRSGQGMQYDNLPLYRHAAYGERLTGLRLGIDAPVGAVLTLKSLITAVDTRHPINNAVYVMACRDYLAWTGDVAFLRANVDRMLAALRYAMSEFDVRAEGCVRVPWVGHDGVSGITLGPDGTKRVHVGRGVGNNYWDLLPFGGKDAQATLYVIEALKAAEEVGRAIEGHPEWSIPAAKGHELAALAEGWEGIRERARALFWNERTGRFVGWIDVEGRGYDVGHTTLNLEAIHHGFASEAQAGTILEWLAGERTVGGDTSTGADIYRWRFAPRATTVRNVETYAWVWSNPETIPWGDQVQDGGAVLGWSYFDLMGRLQVRGADDAWSRLREILAWFEEVQAAGGYRAYYAQPGRGTLQGSGTPGGLGLDAEFFESVLVPQVMVRGFLGLEPGVEATRIAPRLPAAWPSLTVAGIHLRGHVVDLTAAREWIEIRRRSGDPAEALVLRPVPGVWHVTPLDGEGGAVQRYEIDETGSIPVVFGTRAGVRLVRVE